MSEHNWKKEKPSEEGAYWLKGNIYNAPNNLTLVRVEWYDGELCVVACDNPDEPCDFLSDWTNDFFWDGPLFSPKSSASQQTGPDKQSVPNRLPTDAAFRWLVKEEVEPEKSISLLYRRLADLLDEDQWEECEALLSKVIREQTFKVPVTMTPVAWRCKDFGDDWILFHSRGLAVHYKTQTDCCLQELIVQPSTSLSLEEVDVICQWFTCVQAVCGGFLNHADFVLAKKMYEMAKLRVPDSILDKTLRSVMNDD